MTTEQRDRIEEVKTMLTSKVKTLQDEVEYMPEGFSHFYALRRLAHDIAVMGEELDDLMDDYWSENQKKFIEDAEDAGYEVSTDYSGRGMYGTTCPSICVDDVTEFNSESSYAWDNMGLSYVLYARS